MHFNGTIRKEVTPARLIALLKLVSYKKYNKEQLSSLIQPKALNKSGDSEFNLVYKFAIDTGLIDENIHKHLILKMDNEILEDESKFKQFIVTILMGDPESDYNKITSNLLNSDGNLSINNKREDFILSIINYVNADSEGILGWKIWAKYLGFGYNLFDEFFILNPYKRIDEINNYIRINNLFDDKVTCSKYFNKVKSIAPEFSKAFESNQISYPLSLAINTLIDNGSMKVEYVRDSIDIWHMQEVKLGGLSELTHIKLGGD